MNTKITVSVFVFLIFLSAYVAAAQQPAVSLGITLPSPEVRTPKDRDDAFRVATDSGAQVIQQRDHPIIDNEQKRNSGLALKNRVDASGHTGQSASTYSGVAKFFIPLK